MSLSYAYEKLMVAVDVLATSPQSIQDRIEDAFISGFSRINPNEDLPEKLRADFQQLQNQVTRVPATGDEGTLRATMRVVTDEEATEIAEKILHLFHQVLDELQQEQYGDVKI